MIRALALLMCVAPTALAGPSPADGGPSVTLRRQADGAVVEVEGLAPEDLGRLAGPEWGGRRWAELFPVSVAGQGAGQPPVLGSYRIEAGVLRFTPRFPFVPGLPYRAEFRPALLPGRAGARPIAAQFTLPKPTPASTPLVREVYPSRSALPENQLKFYLHFSTPMRQGDVYDYIHLLDANGKEIDGAFLKLDEELWDRDGRRLTLFIDPGRIKRDVGPREGFGPVLVAAKDYTLLIDARWPDAEGRSLEKPYRKAFRTIAADAVCPDINSWRIRPPAAGTLDPLVVESPESLDQALFSRLVRVQGPEGREVAGLVAVTDEETRWTFTPERRWGVGTHQLAVDVALEDLAGNNLQRPFELDVFESVGRRVEARVVQRGFDVRANP